MDIPATKKLICLTGNVWTGGRAAPRQLLVNKGFVRPTWFTTRQRITDADYRHISAGMFHLRKSRNQVLANVEYGGDFIGIMVDDLAQAFEVAQVGVLIVGPQEIVAKIAREISTALVFTFKDSTMETSSLLGEAERNGQLQRIDIDMLQPGAWSDAYDRIVQVAGL